MQVEGMNEKELIDFVKKADIIIRLGFTEFIVKKGNEKAMIYTFEDEKIVFIMTLDEYDCEEITVNSFKEIYDYLYKNSIHVVDYLKNNL